ncbi:hypothetical protein LV84_03968 [Algoriphagus ratkowskyi]|uniref:Bifunctional isocitrate dehydrogenase kinase/phosphatase n=1 Tax=Algoriphagus ratkowskyi TaxID=57028 RepID=A0A2W7QU14_9BACT|nr:hypothetical protein [Algoriphagus ratkowskyi]PZX50656.1 hypothetical protein LV84_03968 [Algoriphagus ratkowskyi]TXD80013.1 hypothetical protein ESW18_02485 [Algoriphagus ratkowskyi]
MRSLKFTSTYFATLSVAVFFVFACDNKEKGTEDLTGIISIDEDELSRNKAQIDQGLTQIKNWKTHWGNNLGDFDSKQFELVMTDSIDPMEMPERNPILKDDPLFPYQIPHPAGNGTMDIYSYKVEAQDAIDEPFLNPDSEVVWYRGDGMKERLLFMGPSGMFEEGLWLNDQEFLVFGFFQEEAGYRPMAWLINVVDHNLKQFRFVKVSQSYDPQSYLNAKIKQVDLS